jgi:uncharacterized membrane protein
VADLIMLKFDHPYQASRALSGVRALEELHYAWIEDVAVLEKHKSGLVTMHTPHGSAAGGALLGGLLGMLLFWWFPPAWFLGGWLGGLGAGALIGEAAKRAGISDDLVRDVKGELTPGTSALLLIGATGDADEMARAFEQYHPVKVIRHSLSDSSVDNLRQAFGEQPSGGPAGDQQAEVR